MAQGHDIIAIGASAGGIQALREIVSALDPDLPAAIFVVQHIGFEGPSVLPSLLTRWGRLPAQTAREGATIQRGTISVAPPDHHLLVALGHMRVRRGPQENRTRPAIDPLFRSAAVSYGPRAIGVVLSGALNDGTAGLAAIKRCGGITVVQDPADALWPSMPASACKHVQVDHRARARTLGALLNRLAREPAAAMVEAPPDIVAEMRFAQQETITMQSTELGRPTEISCPDCHGTLHEISDGDLLRYRCNVGHAYTAEALVVAQAEAVERALWIALRTHEDRLQLFTRMADHARQRGQMHSAHRWEVIAAESGDHITALRQALRIETKETVLPEDTEEEPQPS